MGIWTYTSHATFVGLYTGRANFVVTSTRLGLQDDAGDASDRLVHGQLDQRTSPLSSACPEYPKTQVSRPLDAFLPS